MEFRFPPKQEYLFIEMLRDARFEDRFRMTLQMSWWEITRQREEIARENPAFTPEEVKLKWMEIHYGAELANAVREELRNRRAAEAETAESL